MTVACLCLSLSSVSAQEANDELRAEFEQRLAKSSSQNRTITSRFTQKKSVPGIKNSVESNGNFYYDNSGKMAMIYESPAGDKVVMNGASFTIVVAGKRMESGEENPIMAQISYMMQASMAGDIQKLGRGWDLSIEMSGGDYRVEVRPTERRVKRYVEKMEMIFDGKTLTANILAIHESRGGVTTYTFHNKQINAEIDNKLFIP